jgi:hypothetical protein
MKRCFLSCFNDHGAFRKVVYDNAYHVDVSNIYPSKPDLNFFDI